MTTARADRTLPSWPMMQRPGFLIRRMHQIHTALFQAHCVEFDITPVQYSMLSALASRGQADQTTLAADVLLDRTTATGALTRLQARGLVERVVGERDRRARMCRLTPIGAETLARMEAAARQAHSDTISLLGDADQRKLLDLLGRLVAGHGDLALRTSPPA